MYKLELDTYDVSFGDSSTILKAFFRDKNYSSIGLLVDENTTSHCLSKMDEDLIRTFQVIEIPSGEQHKTIETCQSIWKKLLELGFDRYSLLINLGGGVIGDMGGFCAATYMRGIDFVQIPTTLLSQVDASVGGKLAVDLGFIKNIVGCFCNPNAVIIDRNFLQTLTYEQLRSGFAEVVKHGLIADKNLWNQCKSIVEEGITYNRFTEDLLIESIAIKRNIVMDDPREKSVRKVLNYGHTIGHAIETASYNRGEVLEHGEAIIVGMICENYVAYAKSLINRSLLDEVNTILTSIFYKKNVCDESEKIWVHMQKDKKNKLQKVYCALIESIGSARFDIEITREEVMDSFSYYQKLK